MTARRQRPADLWLPIGQCTGDGPSDGRERSIRRRPDPERLLWFYTIAVTLAAGMFMSANGIRILFGGLEEGFYVGDFVVFWTAARAPMDAIYDFVEITRAQLPITGERGLRPFISPPTSLLLMRPFGQLALPEAFAAWSVVGLGAFIAGARRIIGWRPLLIVLIGPMTMDAALTGQTSLLVGGLMFVGVASGNRHVAGAAFGLAACIKPQAALLVPLALIAARDWRALRSSFLTGLAVGALTIALWGFEFWLQWIECIRPFNEIVLSTHLRFAGPTPTALAHLLGLPGWAGLLGIPAGIALVWRSFRNEAPLSMRVGALLIGCLLSTPYALIYELAPLTVVTVPLLLSRGSGRVAWLGAASVYADIASPVGIILLAIVIWRQTGQSISTSSAPDPGRLSSGSSDRLGTEPLAIGSLGRKSRAQAFSAGARRASDG